MSAPQPSSALDGHCSAINDNTLYVLSSDSFQSLPLKENATWSTLPIGTPVTGPACVIAIPNGDESQAAFYVVGGTAQDSQYAGLQRYFFSNQTWETLTPPTLNMQGRTNHGAAYLNESSSILVYAGSQPSAESTLSSQTFVISALPPYNIMSYTSQAPPASSPILLPWDSSTAVMLGGDLSNTEIWTFGPSQGWNQLNTSLSSGLDSQVRATIIDGTDGSRVLETFDTSVSPNEVQQIVLLDAGGKPATTGQTAGSSSTRKRKRDLTLQDWPSYNSSLAPSALRTDCSVAQNSAGMAVIAGGNEKTSINIFNDQTNSWVDNGLFFDGKSSNNQEPLVSSTASSSTVPSATSTKTSSATSSAPAVLSSGSASRAHMLKVLGITLGVLCGIAAFFILALLLLRWRKQRKRKNQDYINEKADRMSFQDRGAPFMKEAGGSNINLHAIPPSHRFTEANASHSSFAIMAGRIGHGSRHSRNGGEKGSDESTRQLVRPNKTDISGPLGYEDVDEKSGGAFITRKPVPRQEPTVPAATINDKELAVDGSPDPGRKRSSGWSRYFAPTEPQLPSAYNNRNLNESNTTSNYTSDSNRPSMPSRIPSSALVPPLDIDFSRGVDGQRLSNVVSKSPSFNHSAEDLALRGSSMDAARGQRAHIGYSDSRNHLDPSRGHESYASDDESTSSQSPSMQSSRFGSSEYYAHDSTSASAWTPVSALNFTKAQPTANTAAAAAAAAAAESSDPRPPSSNYTNSVYGDNRIISGRGNTGFFPGNRDAYRPTSRTKARSPTISFPVPPKSSSGGIGGLTSSNSGGLSSSNSGGLGVNQRGNEDRDSTMTVFPRGVPSAYYASKNDQDRSDGQPARELPNEDMSWLNLGLGSRM